MTPSIAKLAPPPTGDFLNWAIQNPDEVSAYLRVIYALSRSETVLTIGAQTVRTPVTLSPENAVFQVRVPE